MRFENNGRIQIINYNNNDITLKTLPTPAGNGRTVSHFFEPYNPTEYELELKLNKQPYAINYRKRIYRTSFFLD